MSRSSSDDVVHANGEGAARAAAQLGREALGNAANVGVCHGMLDRG